VTEKTRKTPWGLMVLLGAMTALGPLAIDMYLPSLPAMGAELHASSAQTQATVATFLAGMAIGQLFYGPASDRFGRKPPILLGLAIYVIAGVGCALAVSAPVLIGLRFLQALGACAGAVVSRAIVRDRFDHVDTARMLSLMTLIMGLAPIFAPLIGGVLLTLSGWRSIFGFMTVVGALVGAAVLLRLTESRSADTAAQARSEHPVRAYLSLLSNRRLVGYALAAALNGATLFAYVSSSADLLIGVYHIPPAAFGWVFGLNAVAVIGASQLNRRLLRNFTPDHVLERAAYLGVAAAALLVVAALSGAGGRWSVLPMLFMVLASYGLMQGNTMAGALNLDPRRAGSISALMGACSFATGAGAAAVVGLLHDGTARPMALVILAAMSGSALMLRTLALPKKS
jgi:DHA1 family bicyclomycin/chloramphenicol resistance-like MFS transporter